MNRVLFSKKSDNWSTPDAARDDLYKEFHLNFDPCPLLASDGLLRAWPGRAFVNPPYSDIAEWLNKSLLEIRSGRCELAVFLLPSRTGTSWFHEIVLPHATEIRWLRGRLRFGGSSVNAPFDSFVAVFGKGDKV
jgi:hypothetical protein